MGLLGSKYWTSHPTVPLDHVAAMINIDMIGRLRGGRLSLYGSRSCRGFRRLASEQNVGLNFVIDFDFELKGDSDHYPFYSKQIPFLFAHTGLHNDYHRPSDDPEKINAEGVRRSCSWYSNWRTSWPSVPTARRFARPCAKNRLRPSTGSISR